MSDKYTAKNAIEELQAYRDLLMECPSDSAIDTGTLMAKAMELFLKMGQANGVNTGEEQCNLPVVTNRYYFDCWKRDGKLRSIVILAASEEDAIAIFKSKYPDMNFDRPFI